MSAMILIPIAVAALGIAGSAVASGYETGLYVLNRVRLAVRAGRGEPRAVRLKREIEHPERLLSTLLVVNNIANYAGSLGIAAILSSTTGLCTIGVVVLNTVLVVPLLFIFGETLPKDLFRIHADSWSYRLATPLVWVRYLLTICGLVPLMTVVGRLCARIFGAPSGFESGPRSRMAQLLRESVGSGGLSSEQATLADRALAMDRRTVANEMTPWRSVVAIKQRDGKAGVQAAPMRTERSRLPVIGDDGQVLGTVEVLKSLLQPEQDLETLIEPVPRIPSDTRVLEALEQLRTERKPMAVVMGTGANPAPVGIVTLKDLVEPLMGDLQAW